MASEKQIAANRRNAGRSTGPKTAEGKGRVRLNALKHGLTAETVVLPGEDAAALEARVDAWKDDLRPGGVVEDYLAERAAHASWQLDRADRTIAARLTERMQRESIARATREAEEVDILARALFWDPLGPVGLYPHVRQPGPLRRLSWTDGVHDPIDPVRIVHRLEAFAAGCRWLLDRWGELRKILDDGRRWQAPDRLRAVRLLGKQPMDALDDERVLSVYLACRAMDPQGPSAFADQATEMHAEEAILFARRAEGRDVAGRTPADPAAGREALLATVDRAVDRLEVLLGVRREQEAEAGPRRPDSLAFDDTEDGERLRRYQQARERALFRTIATLSKVRKEWARDPGDEPSRPDAPGGGDAPASIVAECPGGDVDETKPIAGASAPARDGLPAIDSPESRPRADAPAGIGSPDPELGPTADLPVAPDPVPPDPAGRPPLRPLARSAGRARAGAGPSAGRRPTEVGVAIPFSLPSRPPSESDGHADGEMKPTGPPDRRVPRGWMRPAYHLGTAVCQALRLDLPGESGRRGRPRRAAFAPG